MPTRERAGAGVSHAGLPASRQGPGRQAREAHRVIGADLDAVEAQLTRLTKSEPDADQAGEALRGIEHLARELSTHFAWEEAAGGIFAKALDVAPRLERRVLGLRRRHGPLGSEIQQILEDAGYAGVARDAWRRVAKRFGVFARALRNHERAEDRLIADAYLQDLGSGD
jgi:hypothetical protein